MYAHESDSFTHDLWRILLNNILVYNACSTCTTTQSWGRVRSAAVSGGAVTSPVAAGTP